MCLHALGGPVPRVYLLRHCANVLWVNMMSAFQRMLSNKNYNGDNGDLDGAAHTMSQTDSGSDF